MLRAWRVTTLVAATLAVSAHPAAASFPGANGRIFFGHSGGTTWSMNPDGSDPSQVSDQAISGPWSPAGTMMVHENPLGSPADFTVWSADGMHVADVSVPDNGHHPSWTPDGRIVYDATREVCVPSFCEEDPGGVWVVNMDGTGNTKLMDDGIQPAFSPEGSKIAFIATNSTGGYSLYVANADGSGRAPLASDISIEYPPEWSPDGHRIGFVRLRSNRDLWSIAADGTDERQLTFTQNQERALAWSPDGSKIAVTVSDPTLSGSAGIWTLNAADGSGLTKLRDDGGVPYWRPIVVDAYARPKGATPTRVPLVPAFRDCSAPNDQHGAPLSYGSCKPPVQASAFLTVGAPPTEAPNSIGFVLAKAIPGNSSTTANEADLDLEVSVTDVREALSRADYGGELGAQIAVRITDRNNAGGGTVTGTVEDTSFSFAVPCIATADVSIGSTCAATTSANAIAPGSILESKRSIWQLGQIQLFDGGPDADADTPNGDTLFMDQGVFVP